MPLACRTVVGKWLRECAARTLSRPSRCAPGTCSFQKINKTKRLMTIHYDLTASSIYLPLVRSIRFCTAPALFGSLSMGPSASLGCCTG